MRTQSIGAYRSSYSPLQRRQNSQRYGKRIASRRLRGRQIRLRRRQVTLNRFVLVLLAMVSMVGVHQANARLSAVSPQQPMFQALGFDRFHRFYAHGNSSSWADLQAQGSQLFATPNSIGTIALGAAEGTRTPEGRKTLIWHHHTDPGNGAINKGTFSWQLGAATPEEADLKGLARIRLEAIPALIQAAEREQLRFDVETLVQGADLWNQAPGAGINFVRNLKRCLEATATMDAAVLCARVESFYDPVTGELDASGFNDDRAWLEDDQRRRMEAIKTVLQLNQLSLMTKALVPPAQIDRVLGQFPITRDAV